ncbi:MAG: DUF488 domain-containing protein [Kofleriaceae bacterium]
MIQLKRAYERPAKSDGYRVLVDRLWPRGVAKRAAHIDEWLKEVAPSDGLRRWFGHEPSRFAEFRARYKRELHAEPAHTALTQLAHRAADATVTLVYSAHDEAHNNAVVLAEELATSAKRTRRPARRQTPAGATRRRAQASVSREPAPRGARTPRAGARPRRSKTAG